MKEETPRCKNCGEKTIKWFNRQVLTCYHCSNCGKDTPLKENKEIPQFEGTWEALDKLTIINPPQQ